MASKRPTVSAVTSPLAAISKRNQSASSPGRFRRRSRSAAPRGWPKHGRRHGRIVLKKGSAVSHVDEGDTVLVTWVAVEAIHALAGNPQQTSIAQRPVTGVDFAFDCIGLKTTMEQIVPACRPGHFGVCQGGTAVLVGVPSTTVELNAGEILGQEKQFRGSIGGSCAPDRDFPTFLDWHARGELDLDALVTERYPIERINDAAQALTEGRISGRAILEFADA